MALTVVSMTASWVAGAASITEYPIVDSIELPHSPANLAPGTDGNLWFTDSSGQYVGSITPSGATALFALPGPTPAGMSDTALAIAGGADGNLWFGMLGGQIGKISPAGNVTLFPIGDTGTGTMGMARGPDGNLWFLEGGAFTIENVDRITSAGVVTQFPIPPVSGSNLLGNEITPSAGITTGADGNLWFAVTDYQQCSLDTCGQIIGSIGRMTTAGVVTEYPLPANGAAPIGITAGPDGNVWFTEIQISTLAPYSRSGGKIGRITPTGAITEFSIPTADSRPSGITTGPDGNLWFTENQANQIASITPAGVVTEFAIPTPNSGPVGIAAGADGNIWFAESSANNIGKLTLSSAPVFVDGYMSGNWYDPAQSGQGFQLEMADGDTMVAIWFTFAPDGSGQNWIYAQGTFDSTKNSVTLPAQLVTGAMFPPHFNVSDVTKTPWGTLTFTFTGCDSGTVAWSSTLPGYGSGTLPISRLTRIKGTTCP
jgi:streptogramin lyase